MERTNERIADLQSAYDSALKSGDRESIRSIKKELDEAKRNQTLRSEEYNAMVRSTAKELSKVNENALDYLNDKTEELYALNFNSVEEFAIDTGISFNLIDERAVRIMMTENPDLLPPKKLDIPKDMRWNIKKMNSAVTQGIIQGESMHKIAKRLEPIINTNYSSAIRNARTMTMSISNRSYSDGLWELQKQYEKHHIPIKMYKVWMSTGDSLVRESHADIDGEEVPLDEPFGNGLMYPAEAGGPPEEVYNCRCSLGANPVVL